MVTAASTATPNHWWIPAARRHIRALAAGAALAAASLPALAQTIVTNGQTITSGGSYKIPDGVGTVTFTAIGGGGGGGGRAGTGNYGGGAGGSGVLVSTTRANAGGLVFSVVAGTAGGAGSNGSWSSGTWCGTKGSDGGTTSATANGSTLIKAAGGSGGGTACSNGGTTTAGAAGLNGNCSNPWTFPGSDPSCTSSNNRGSGAISLPPPINMTSDASAGGAGSVKVSWTMATQTITCPSLPRLSVLGTATPLAASSSLAGATFSYSGGTPSVCTIGNGQLTPTGWGTCSYTVLATGNGATNPASQVCNASVAPDYAISGTVSGLVGAGTTATIANLGTQVAQAGNSQTWTASVSQGSYNITATAVGHICQVTNGMGFLTGQPPQNAPNVAVVCTPDAYPLSGTISGAAGPVELRVGTTPYTLASNPFTLTSVLGHGSSYALTVSPPADQACTVTPTSTGVVSGPVTNVQIACGYPLRVAVSGLNESRNLVLQRNGANDRWINANGTQSLGWVPLGDAFAITVKTQPQGQTCKVDATSASGAMGAGLVVPVNCTSNAGTSDQFDLSGTWTVPPGVTSVTIEVAGGGGSGGAAINGIFGTAAGGTGGAGGRATRTSLAVTPGEIFRFQVGAGGTDAGGSTSSLYRLSVNPATPMLQGTGGARGGNASSYQNPGDMFPTGVPGAVGQNGACLPYGGFTSCAALGGPGGAGAPSGMMPQPSTPGTNGWVKFTTPQPTLATQTITCGAASKTYGDADFDFPTATVVPNTVGGPTGALAYGNASGACSAANGKLQITGAGTCTYSATAADIAGVLAPATQSCTVAVAKMPTQITTSSPATSVTVGSSIGLTSVPTPALAPGETVTYTTNTSGSICAVAPNGTLTAMGSGTCNVTATRSGNTNLLGSTSQVLAIQMTLPVFTVSGTVTGLVGGQSASVSNQGGTAQAVANGGTFSFSVQQGSPYSITATAAHHTCTPSPVSGTVSGAVSGIAFSCTPVQYGVSGTVTGLSNGATATVSLGGAAPQTTGGAFSFPSSVAYASPYSVSATATGYTCTPATGTVSSGDVSGANVVCTALGTQAIACNAPSKTFGDAAFDFPAPTITTTPGGEPHGAISFALPAATTPPTPNACELWTDPAQPQSLPQLRITSAGTCSYTTQVAPTPKLAANTQTCNITVAKAAPALTVGGDTADLLAPGTRQLSATLSPAVPGATINWSAAGSCTVSHAGLVTAGAVAGMCTVTASFAGDDNHESASKTWQAQITLPSYTISGTVTGLVGGQSASVSNQGGTAQGNSFSFNVTQGDSYSISATAPHHTCTPLTGGPVNANVANLQLACQPVKYSIGGTVTGLSNGATATVSLGSAAPQTTGGVFSFASSVAYASPYSVSATATGYTCTPATGTVSGDVAGAVVACVANKYTLNYTVSGLLSGNTVVMSLGGVDIPHATNSTVSHTNALTHGQPYALTVKTQPQGQTCTVSANGSGSSATGAVTGVAVACVSTQYTISASVTGLPANATLVLRNNGSDDLSFNANSTLSFATKVSHNGVYAVTVQTTPTGYTCTVAHGSGTATADVGNVTVACAAQPRTVGGTISGLTGTAQVQLANPGSPAQTLGNGAFSFATTYGSAYAVTATPPAGHSCSVANGSGTVGADVANVQVACQVLTYTLSGAAQPAMGGAVACPAQAVAHGAQAICSATAQPGWRFKAFDAASGCTRTSGAAGATCEIDDVQAQRTVTAQFEPYFAGTTVPTSGNGGPASATFTGGGATCRFSMADTAFVAAPATLPVGKTMPQGMFRFKLVGCDTSPVTVAITWPRAVQGLTKFGQATAQAAAPSHFAPNGLFTSGNLTRFTVQDGKLGDDDWAENGVIVDPVGPTEAAAAAAPMPVPTLSGWALVLLSMALVSLLAWRRDLGR